MNSWQPKDISLYGETVKSDSYAYMEACEARSLLDMPLDKRRAEIAARVKKRGRGSAGTEGAIRAGLEKALTKEWEWRKAQKVT